mgnify:CR=1 FL=1
MSTRNEPSGTTPSEEPKGSPLGTLEAEAAPIQEVRLSPQAEALLTDIAKSRDEEEKRRSRRATTPAEWVRLRKEKFPIPNKVPPGYAIISDNDGNGIQVIECSLVMMGSPDTEVMPIDGRSRGTTLLGALVTNITSRETVVLQFTKYPEFRDDGELHIRKTNGEPGVAVYPNAGKAAQMYQEFDGTFYNRNHVKAREMEEAARKEAGPALIAKKRAELEALEAKGV